MTPTDVIPGHTTEVIDDTTEIVHDAHTQPLIHIILTMTLHITHHLDIAALQLTTEIAADHTVDQDTTPPGKGHTNLPHIYRNPKAKHIPKGIQQSQ